MHFDITVSFGLISPYAIAIMASFFISFSVAAVLMLRDGVNTTLALTSPMVNTTLALYGGYLYSSLSSGEFREIALSAMGGACGVMLSTMVLGLIFRDFSAGLWKAYMVSLPLTYAISKVGCLLAGCCHGIPYSGPFCVQYHGSVIDLPAEPVFPVQLAETICFTIIFLIGLWLVYFKQSRYGITVVLCLGAFAKFALDFLRDSHPDQILSINQVACLMGAGLVVLRLAYYRVRETGSKK